MSNSPATGCPGARFVSARFISVHSVLGFCLAGCATDTGSLCQSCRCRARAYTGRRRLSSRDLAGPRRRPAQTRTVSPRSYSWRGSYVSWQDGTNPISRQHPQRRGQGRIAQKLRNLIEQIAQGAVPAETRPGQLLRPWQWQDFGTSGDSACLWPCGMAIGG